MSTTAGLTYNHNTKITNMRWILASILYNREVRPDHFGAIREILDYPDDNELLEIIRGEKPYHSDEED